MGEEENTEETQISMPAFHQNSAMATTHNNKSLHVFRRGRRRRREVKELLIAKEEGGGGGCAVERRVEGGGGGEEEDDSEELERKIHALQKIVPGGESLGVDKLFDETAGYIVALQCQVKALRAHAGFFEKLEKEKTKFGG